MPLLFFSKAKALWLLIFFYFSSEELRAIDYDNWLKYEIAQYDLTGNPAENLKFPDIKTSRLAQLGRELFFSKSLSVGFDVACASCHHPFLAGGDGLSLPVGVGAVDEDLIGPGRRHDGNYHVDPEADGGPNVERNSPTTFNSALYQHALFNDGRVERVLWQDGQYIASHEFSAKAVDSSKRQSATGSEKALFKTPESIFRGPDILAGDTLLQAQARFPVIAAAEMRGFSSHIGSNNAVRAYLAKRFRGETRELKTNEWEQRFRDAFNEQKKPIDELITFEHISLALAEYQRSQIFIDNPWKAYLEGKGKISRKAKEGGILFFSGIDNGGAGCATCHSGDFFTNEKYLNLAIPQFGRGNFVYGKDLGRYPVTRRDEDLYAFRVPSLLNVTETAPYGHTGAFADLDSMIRHHLDPEKSLKKYDFKLQHLPQFKGLGVEYPEATVNTNIVFQQMKAAGMYRMPSLGNEQVDNLIEFLKTLTDPCVTDRECLALWIPSDKPADEHRLIARIPNTFKNDIPLPKVRESQSLQSAALPDLGDVPPFNPVCRLSENINVSGTGFAHVTKESGITVNRQFDFDKLNTSLAGDGLVVLEHLIFSGGVAAGDINGDCYSDLIINQGNAAGAKVYLNNANGTFREAPDRWGIDESEDLTASMLVDLNGDGWLDLFYGNTFGSAPGIYLNNGKSRFLRVTRPGFKVGHVTMGAGFGDVDGDGDLDAFLAHWARPSKAEEEHLWLNQGNGLFSPGARTFGLAGHFGERDFTFTPNFSDLNNDGKADLISVADFLTSQVFLNKGNQSYLNITDKEIITDQNGMGAAIADFDNDGDLDWFVTSVFYPKPADGKEVPDYFPFIADGNRLYRNDGRSVNIVNFTDITDKARVRDGGWGWGACAADFDNDGWLDIFQTNGVPFIASEVRKDLHYLFPVLGIEGFHSVLAYKSFMDFREKYQKVLNKEQMSDLESLYYVAKQLDQMHTWTHNIDPKAKLFINDKKGSFVESAEILDIADPGQGRGISCLDYDRDGDIDILIVNNQGPPSLYRNDFGNSNSFLTVRLVGQDDNIYAIGARVFIETDSGKQMREVKVENNYLSQNPVESHFGIGENSEVKKLTVVWPDGSKSEKTSIKPNQILVIKQ